MNRWVICITSLLILSLSAYALDTSYQVEGDLPIQVASQQIDPNSLTLSLNISAPGWNVVGSAENPVSVAEFTGSGFLEEEGFPIVPVSGRMFRIPPDAGVSVEVLSYEFETLTDVDYAAYYGDGLPGELSRTTMTSDEWFPGKLAEVAEPVIFRDFRISNLSLYPVQVNPARREVRVYSNIQVRINYEGTDDRAVLDAWPVKISSTYLPWYRMFLDWDENELDEYELYRGSIQVIMQDDDPLHNSLEPWVEWKLQKGWEIDFLTDSDVNNWNANNIINELQDRWEDMDEKFDYIVIIGDGNGLFSVPAAPTRNLGDYGYSLMTDDEFQDVTVGRISINSVNELNDYIHKVLEYEKEPYMEETDWYLHGAVMGVSHYSGISTYLVGHYWRSELFNIGFTQVDTAFSVNAEPARGQSIGFMNAGVSYFNFRGGISDGPTVTDINNLENTHKLFVACDVTCVTGDWSSGTSQSEAYMRAGSANSPTGGICGMGMATATTNTGRNNTVSGGLAFTMFRQRLPFLGQGFFGSKVALYRSYGENEFARFREFSEMFNLMGDPTVMIWTAIPQVMNVEASNTINLGQNGYNVSVTDSQGEPLPDAWVTLYKVDDDEEVIARGISNAEGMVLLNAPFRFAGEAVLTVTAQNYHPEIIEVEVGEAEAQIGYELIDIQDDGENGTSGNGNSIPEAGETIGLVITAKNFGNTEEQNVVVSAVSLDPWITRIDSSASFGNIQAGESIEADDLILVELAPETQHNWINHLELTFSSEAGEYIDDFPLKVNAPQYAFEQVTGTADLEPGETVEITVRVRNIGGSNADASTGHLISLDPFLSIGASQADFDAINVGQSETSGEFIIAAHPETIPGRISRARLIIVTQSGQVDSLVFNITIGDVEPSDPTGPDSYGYYAFDDLDTGYDLAPVYDWVEINPGAPNNDYDGENLGMSDTGNNDDESVVLDLPFPVQYYGQVFNEVTICTNGWLAMGNEGWFTNMRNYYIPSPLGPHNMIAPYWDERLTSGGGVFAYYDEPNGRFIVEWYRVPDQYNQAPCTFQAIIFDQVENHLTYTHDAEILFQYGPVQHTTGPTGGHGTVPYFTTGIENEAQDDGVLYSYWNSPEPGANAIVDGRAILFSTNVTLITGTIEGYVHRFENDQPVPGMTVRTSDYVFSAVTDEDGYFLIPEVVIGIHDLVVEGIGFNNTYADSIIVLEEDTTTVTFIGTGGEDVFPGMKHPEFNASRDSIYMRINPESFQTKHILINNTGNGTLDYSFKVLFHEPGELEIQDPGQGADSELDDPWDPFYEFSLIEDETRNRGVVFMNNEFWVSGSNNTDGLGFNKFYRYDKEGEYIAVYDQPVDNRSSAGFYGLASDGEYIYSVDRGRIYQMEFTGMSVVLVNSWDCPYNSIRYITYDPDRELLWMGELNSNIIAVNLNGEVVNEFAQDISPRGLAYYGDDEDGFNLYFICRETDDVDYDIKKMNPENGSIQSVIHFDNADGAFTPGGADISNKLNPLVWTFISVMDGSPELDKINIWEVDINTRWIDISPMVNTIDPGFEETVDVTVYTTDLPVAFYEAWLEISHTSIEQRYIIPMNIEVTEEILDIHNDTPEIPLEWAFKGAYPNPFNPTVTLDFELKNSVLVEAHIYNLLGQKVATIADQSMRAGRHTLNFNGKNLSSGMYFLNFEAGPLKHTQKLILMK